jgi:hypothetical protein
VAPVPVRTGTKTLYPTASRCLVPSSLQRSATATELSRPTQEVMTLKMYLITILPLLVKIENEVSSHSQKLRVDPLWQCLHIALTAKATVRVRSETEYVHFTLGRTRLRKRN